MDIMSFVIRRIRGAPCSVLVVEGLWCSLCLSGLELNLDFEFRFERNRLENRKLYMGGSQL